MNQPAENRNQQADPQDLSIVEMLITSCVIPILVLLVFFWLIKVFLDLDFTRNIEFYPGHGNRKRERSSGGDLLF